MVSRIKLNIIVFVSGFVLMVFEIVGSRVLAPFLGSSSVVWTSIIGIILGFMSIGYWYGGKMADKYHSVRTLAKVLITAAVAILVMNLGKNIILQQIASFPISLISKSLIASAILFSIPSFLMAFVTPFAIRLKVKGVEDAGEASGSIYAVSTIGSIAGTFFSGFIFIALIGTDQILWMLAIVLFILAGYISIPSVKSNAIWILILLSGNIYHTVSAHNYLAIDTDYSRVVIKDEQFKNRDIRYMYISGYVNSGMYLDKPNELAFDYTQFYDLFDCFQPNWNNIVMFGGAGYSYPKHFMNKFPHRRLDVVEIDPKLTKIAKTYFEFTPSNNLTIYHQDARYFLSSTVKKYDVVLYDVLTSNLTVPFHLTTKEAFAEISEIMSDSGVMILNVIGSLDGKGAPFVRSEYKTLKSIFDEVYVYTAQRDQNPELKNYVMVAVKNKEGIRLPVSGPYYNQFLKYAVKITDWEEGLVLTDNFSPANHLIGQYSQ